MTVMALGWITTDRLLMAPIAFCSTQHAVRQGLGSDPVHAGQPARQRMPHAWRVSAHACTAAGTTGGMRQGSWTAPSAAAAWGIRARWVLQQSRQPGSTGCSAGGAAHLQDAVGADVVERQRKVGRIVAVRGRHCDREGHGAGVVGGARQQARLLLRSHTPKIQGPALQAEHAHEGAPLPVQGARPGLPRSTAGTQALHRHSGRRWAPACMHGAQEAASLCCALYWEPTCSRRREGPGPRPRSVNQRSKRITLAGFTNSPWARKLVATASSSVCRCSSVSSLQRAGFSRVAFCLAGRGCARMCRGPRVSSSPALAWGR